MLVRPTRSHRDPTLPPQNRRRSCGGGVFLLLCIALTCCASTAGRTDAVDQEAPVRFVYVDASASSVCVAGSFNGWSDRQHCMRRDGINWSITIKLARGRHEYALVVDGDEWRSDPGAPNQVDSGFGRLNSVLIVE